MVSFSLDFFTHFLLTFRHQFSYFFHVEIWNFGLLLIGSYLLNLIRKENGQLRAIELITVLTIIIKILFIYFFYELSLH